MVGRRGKPFGKWFGHFPRHFEPNIIDRPHPACKGVSIGLFRHAHMGAADGAELVDRAFQHTDSADATAAIDAQPATSFQRKLERLALSRS